MTGTENDTRGFRGWPVDALVFLDELARDNNRRFWTENAHRYRAAVHDPTRALAAALTAEFGVPRVFRPHVDRRFRPAADPYRIDTGAMVAGPGGTPYTLVLSTRGLAVQVGYQLFDTAQLRAYRSAVDGEAGAELEAVLAVLHGVGLAPDGVSTLTDRPRGCPRDHPRLALMRLRGLHVDRAWPAGEWLATEEAQERVRAAWRAARPLADWLDAHVGPRVGQPADRPGAASPGTPDDPGPGGTADHDAAHSAVPGAVDTV